MQFEELMEMYRSFVEEDKHTVSEVNAAIASFATEASLLFSDVLCKLFEGYKMRHLV